MNKLKIFKNRDFGEIRAQEIKTKPYVCLADVCKILDLEQVSRVKSRLNQDGVIISKVIDKLGREQNATFINESNLYKVIFQSRKLEAEKFTEWVTSEVLPSIRKNGMYATDELLNNPDLAIKVFEQLKQEREEKKKLQLENAEQKKVLEEQKPKVLFANSVETAKTSILVGELAKIIKQNGCDIGQNRFFEWLRNNNYLISRKGTDYNMPTQKAMKLGLFEIKETSITHADGHISVNKTPKVTGKGQVYFISKFLKK